MVVVGGRGGGRGKGVEGMKVKCRGGEFDP